jgi:hypothetical protein
MPATGSHLIVERSLGKVGHESAAARFAGTTPASDFSIEAEKPYAEVCLRPPVLSYL